MRQGGSFLLYDLYRRNASLCLDNGYNVVLFNTKNFLHSDSWDCFDDLVNASEKDIYNYVNIYSNTFILNTMQGQKMDFWKQNEHDLLRSLMHLIARDEQYEGRRTFEELINLINSPEQEIREKLFAASGRVQNAARSYLAATNDTVREQFRAGLANSLQIYRTPIVARALSVPGIDLEAAVHQKTAIFVVTKDDDSTYDAITSLFVGCLYMKLIEISDSSEYHGSLNVPFWFILDELCNMGAIDALPRKISTSRSRKINFVFALQSMSQLDDKYVRMANNIFANCALKIILGCDDDMTAKYISDKAGTFTQIEYTNMAERPYLKPFRKFYVPLKSRVSEKKSQKKLIEISDVSQIPPGEMYALIARHHVFRGKTYGEDLHYMEKLVRPLEVDDYVADWYLQFEEDHPEMKDSPERTYIPSDYEKLEARNRVAKRNPQSREDIQTIQANVMAEASSINSLRGRITGDPVPQQPPAAAPQNPQAAPSQMEMQQRMQEQQQNYQPPAAAMPLQEETYERDTVQEDIENDIMWDDEIF